MIAYILRRLTHLIPLLFFVSFCVFSITLLLPGDPTVAMLGEEASLAERAFLIEKMGFDEPIPVQYVKWLKSVLAGDFGRSLRTQEPVKDMLISRIPVTAQLALMSVLLAIMIGIPAGIIAAIYRNSWIDTFVSFFSMIGVAMPYFWLGILLIMFFSVKLGWLPPSGYVAFISDPIENLRLMIMPSITIGTAFAALIMRQTRTAMLQILSEDFVRTARAKGAREYSVILRHALPNALIPVVTIIGIQMSALVSGAVVTETIFSMPGLGRMVVEGIFERDFPPLQAAILVIVVGVLLINLVVDMVYATLDKRIKL